MGAPAAAAINAIGCAASVAAFVTAATTAAAAVAKFPLHCLPIASGMGLPRAANLRCLWVARSEGRYCCCSIQIAAAGALLVTLLLLLLWAAAAAIGPVGRRFDCCGCDFRVRKLFPVELSLSVDRLSFRLKLGRLLIINFFSMLAWSKLSTRTRPRSIG